MEWLNIIITVLGLSFINFTFKFVFSKKFRETLRKNDFKNIRDESDEYNNYTSDSTKQTWQLQNATNQYLGLDKFHYSLVIRNFKKYWDFRNKVRDLNFAFTFIEQKIENENAELIYKYSTDTLKRIEKYNFLVCVMVAIVYILAILFEMFLLDRIVINYGFNEHLYQAIKTVLLTIIVFLLPISALLGSKATIALGLKEVFEIKEKLYNVY